MKKYDTYKDSGNQWIGQVPEHWCLYSLKYYLNLQKGRKPEVFVEEGDLPYVTMDYIRSRENKTCLYPSSAEGLVPISDDDILVLWDGANAGEIVKAKKGFLSSTMAVLDFDKKIGSHQYLFYLLKQMEPIFKTFANGTTIPHFDSSILLDYKYPLPPLTEQEAIANFLDKKTGEIDQAIALFEQEKTDLQAYRKAIISETVTKGLNPNAKLKDSGIQWIGEIPEGWEIVRLKHLLDGTLTYGANESAESDNKEWPRYIRITDIAENGSLKESTFKSLSPDKAENYLLQKGDVLFARSGATVGKTFLFEENISACFAGYLIKATPNKTKLNSRFLYFYTISNAYESWKNSVYIQSTIQNIGADKYSQLPVSTPPLSEQQTIVEYLDKKTSDIDAALKLINTQIADLQAYRTALISEAVTGKIDVRN